MRVFGLLFWGCTANAAPALQLMGVLAPPAVIQSPTTPAQCNYKASLNGPFLSSGTLDIAFAGTYTPTLGLVVYRNDTVTINAADVRVTDAIGNPVSAFSTPASGTVTASGGLVTVTLLDAASVANIHVVLAGNVASHRLVSHAIIHGHASDGTALVTNELSFPIDGCSGCLVQFPLGSDDPTSVKQPNCAAPLPQTELVPCVVGQDQPIDCRTCQSNPVCVP